MESYLHRRQRSIPCLQSTLDQAERRKCVEKNKQYSHVRMNLYHFLSAVGIHKVLFYVIYVLGVSRSKIFLAIPVFAKSSWTAVVHAPLSTRNIFPTAIQRNIVICALFSLCIVIIVICVISVQYHIIRGPSDLCDYGY